MFKHIGTREKSTDMENKGAVKAKDRKKYIHIESDADYQNNPFKRTEDLLVSD